MDRQSSDHKDDMKTIRNQQDSLEEVRNEGKVRPDDQNDVSNDWPEDRDRITARSTSLAEQSIERLDQKQDLSRNQTTGSNTPGSEIADRNSNLYGTEQSNLQQRRDQRDALGSSEQSGQQYSDVGKNTPGLQNDHGMNELSSKKDHEKQDHKKDLSEDEK